MNEFEMIRTYFLPLTMGRREAEQLADDAAIIGVPDGYRDSPSARLRRRADPSAGRDRRAAVHRGNRS